MACEGAGRSRSKPDPNPANSGPHPAKPGQIKRKKTLDFLRRIEPLQRLTPTPRPVFSLCGASGLTGGHGARRRRPFAWEFPFLFISSSSKPFRVRRRAGAVFQDRGLLGAVLSPTWRPRSLARESERPAPWGRRPEDARTKTGRSIRRPARNPLHQARSGVELDKRRGASPSCL